MWDTDEYTPAPSMSEQHNQWHAQHGMDVTCPLDCNAWEGYDEPAITHELIVTVDDEVRIISVYEDEVVSVRAREVAAATGQTVTVVKL